MQATLYPTTPETTPEPLRADRVQLSLLPTDPIDPVTYGDPVGRKLSREPVVLRSTPDGGVCYSASGDSARWRYVVNVEGRNRIIVYTWSSKLGSEATVVRSASVAAGLILTGIVTGPAPVLTPIGTPNGHTGRGRVAFVGHHGTGVVPAPTAPPKPKRRRRRTPAGQLSLLPLTPLADSTSAAPDYAPIGIAAHSVGALREDRKRSTRDYNKELDAGFARALANDDYADANALAKVPF